MTKEIKLVLRLPPVLHQRVKQTAADDRRSLNAEILVLIEEALRARDQQKETSPPPS